MSVGSYIKRWMVRKLTARDKLAVAWCRVRYGKNSAVVEAGRRGLGNVVSGRR